MQCYDRDAHFVVGIRVSLFETRGDQLQVRLRRIESHSGLQPPDRVGRVTAAPAQTLSVHVQRYPHLCRLEGKAETGRHHAYDRVFLGIQRDSAPKHAGVSSEMFSPEPVTEYGH